jgi:lipoate-protein ligase A
MRHCLRIIIDPPCSAAFNMAADRYLLDCSAIENNVILRFYRWDPPAISLGCMQDPDTTIDNVTMEQSGITWIKRPTGGRAILHWNDLTYSIAFPIHCVELGQTIQESYGVISRSLMAGLARAGIMCESHSSSLEYAVTRRDVKLPCFLSPNRSEIMVAGKKLVGSAQKRTAKAVLQHGSLPIDGSFRRLPEFCRIDEATRAAQKKLLEEKCACVQEINPAIDLPTLIGFMVQGFAESFPYDCIEKNWSNEEIKRIDVIK